MRIINLRKKALSRKERLLKVKRIVEGALFQKFGNLGLFGYEA